MYICKRRGAANSSIYYLDDALTVAGNKQECEKSLEIMQETAVLCGFKVQKEKTVGPNRVLEFLGVEIDSVKRQLKITEKRMQEIREELNEWLNRKECTKRQLLSLHGKLKYCANVVRAGSMFTRRIVSLSKKGKCLHSKLRLTKEVQKDILWWIKCIGCHNGIAWFEEKISMHNTVLTFTDASDNAMAGVVFEKWTIFTFSGEFSWMKKKSIAWKELAAVVLTLSTFGRILRGKSVIMNIDNEGIQQALDRGISKNDDIMALIRCVYFYSSIFNISYNTVHVKSQLNIADPLSRQNVPGFRAIYPRGELEMTKPIDFLTDF